MQLNLTSISYTYYAIPIPAVLRPRLPMRAPPFPLAGRASSATTDAARAPSLASPRAFFNPMPER